MAMTSTAGEKIQKILQEAVSHHQSGHLDHAKALYEQVLESDPENPDALHLLGLACFHSGEPGRAVHLIGQAIRRQPGFPPYHDNLAMVCMSEGQFEPALEALRAAERLEGEEPLRCFNTGVACEALGRMEEAESAYRSAVRLDPGESDFHFNLGNLLMGSGRNVEAADSYRRALECNPSAEGALTNLANICLQSGLAGEAVERYSALLRLHPDSPDIRLALGQALIAADRHDPAVDQFLSILDSDPGNRQGQRSLATALRYLDPGEYRPTLETRIIDLLEAREIHPQALARISANQLRHKLGLNNDPVKLREELSSLPAGIESDRLLLLLLTSGLNTDPVLESFIITVRKEVLERLVKSAPVSADLLELAVALAQQCSGNEYIYPADGQELRTVRNLSARVEEFDATSARINNQVEIALVGLAMYQPIAALEVAPAIADIPLEAWSGFVRPLIEKGLQAPLQEASLREQIPSIGKIEDRVSRSVREQYEENPYPRWHSLHVGPRPGYAEDLQNRYPHFQPGETIDGPLSVLAAGCGTGQEAAAIAFAHPDCEVIGLDLSLASLAYAVRMRNELALDNLTFYQGDLLDISRLERRFQVIECTGVLHHMAEPESGWEALTNCLQIEGVMKIGLYSELASSEVNEARSVIRERGLEASAAGIREIRSAILESAPEDPLYPLRFSEDLYTMSACRDLLFHVQEQSFTVSRIQRALNNLGLEFIGFEHSDPGVRNRYLEFNPGDTTLTDLDGWARYEEKNPRTFAEMYVFWCCKRRDPGREQVGEH